MDETRRPPGTGPPPRCPESSIEASYGILNIALGQILEPAPTKTFDPLPCDAPRPGPSSCPGWARGFGDLRLPVGCAHVLRLWWSSPNSKELVLPSLTIAWQATPGSPFPGRQARVEPREWEVVTARWAPTREPSSSGWPSSYRLPGSSSARPDEPIASESRSRWGRPSRCAVPPAPFHLEASTGRGAWRVLSPGSRVTTVPTESLSNRPMAMDTTQVSAPRYPGETGTRRRCSQDCIFLMAS